MNDHDDNRANFWAVMSDGSVRVWGDYSGLGEPYMPDDPGWRKRRLPEEAKTVAGLGPAASLAPRPTTNMGGGPMLAALKDGTVVLFGAGNASVVPNCNVGREPMLPDRYTLPGMTDIVAVAGSVGEYVALRADGSVWRWTDKHVDTQKPSGGCMEEAERLLPAGSATQLVAQNLVHLVLLSDGRVLMWGLDLPLNAMTMKVPTGWDHRAYITGLPRVR